MLHKWTEKLHSSERGIVLSSLRGMLWLVSLFYRMVLACRNECYDACAQLGRGLKFKWFRVNVYNFKPRIISIGNIVAGGTGKTPLTILIAKKIIEKKKNLAILSRGYRSKMESDTFGPQLISKGQGPLFQAHECGDEPYLISQKVPEALFYVGKNRIESARMATAAKANVILLDDGMQYRKLHRDVEIVLLDANDLFGKNHFLPRGLLREHPKSLKRADLIVVNHVNSPSQFDEITNKLKRYVQAPIVGAAPEYVQMLDLKTQRSIDLQNQKVIAFCGIAKPRYFFELLEQTGALLQGRFTLPDHAAPTEAFLQNLAVEAQKKGAQWIVCTEKDAVKMKHSNFNFPIACLQMDLKVKYNTQLFDEVIDMMI